MIKNGTVYVYESLSDFRTGTNPIEINSVVNVSSEDSGRVGVMTKGGYVVSFPSAATIDFTLEDQEKQ